MTHPEITKTHEGEVHEAIDDLAQSISLLPMDSGTRLANLVVGMTHLIVRAIYDAHGHEHTTSSGEPESFHLTAQEDGPENPRAKAASGIFIPGQRVA